MHLTLFVPDLLWPDVENTPAFDFPGAGELARVLSLADPSRAPMSATDSWESRLALLFGFDHPPLPLAALRALGDGLPHTQPMLCADPVNLDFMQQALVLSPVTAETLTEPELQSLLDSLNEEFTGEGRFIAGPANKHAVHAYFIPADGNTSALPNLASTSRLAGRRIDADETRQILGREALQWLNRIQMCLNQHPVNAMREAQGLPVINSLWPWGLGTLEEAPTTRFASVIGDSALLTGLCQTSTTPLNQTRSFSTMTGDSLIVETGLARAISHDDLPNWQNTITDLVANWISPALSALEHRQHRLQALTLICPGTHHEYRWSLHKTAKGIRGNLLQRCLGMRPKLPSLPMLVRSWSA